MNKKLIREMLLKKLKEMRALNFASYQAYKKASDEAPGAMESHSDTSKFQIGAVSGNLAEHLVKLDKSISCLKEGKDAVSNIIEEGAIIKIKDSGHVITYYLVPDGAGGQDLEIDNEKIKTITASTPLGKSILNKKVGDSVELAIGPKTRKLEIISVE